jgi:hypothetical protein
MAVRGLFQEQVTRAAGAAKRLGISMLVLTTQEFNTGAAERPESFAGVSAGVSSAIDARRLGPQPTGATS